MQYRTWLIVLSAVLLTGCTTTQQTSDVRWHYFLTEEEYRGLDDYPVQIKEAYGDLAEVADWSVIKQEFGHDIGKFLDAVGMRVTVDGGALVSRDGDTTYSSSRAYYLTRHGGSKPSHYLAHDQIGGHEVSLGSWDTSQRVLVRIPAVCMKGDWR
jgi:hypothetical protein